MKTVKNSGDTNLLEVIDSQDYLLIQNCSPPKNVQNQEQCDGSRTSSFGRCKVSINSTQTGLQERKYNKDAEDIVMESRKDHVSGIVLPLEDFSRNGHL